MIQKPRYLLASVLLWGAFFCLKLFDDYDGITSWIGAPFVATFLLAISLPITLVLGLSRRIPWFATMWYSGRALASCVLVVSITVLVFGHSLGMQESYTDTNSLGDSVTATRLHSFVSLPAFFLAAFSLLYWPAGAQPHQTHDHINRTNEGEQSAGGNPSRTFRVWFAAATVLLCLSAIWLSWQDKSWGALYIAIIACPIANLALMLLGTITAFIVRRLHPEAKLGQMITTVLSLPPIGAVVTLVVTFTFDLHGC